MSTKLRLTAEQLADFKLPTGRTVNMNEAYRELFDHRSGFLTVLDALRETGKVTPRADGHWRLWDLYSVIRHVGWSHSVVFSEKPALRARTNRFPELHWFWKPDESFWHAVESARLIRRRVNDARYVRQVRDRISGQRRDETDDEFHRRFHRFYAVASASLKALADSLPPDADYWKRELLLVATTAIELQRHGFANSARLCSRHLLAAVNLAEVRLGMPYRAIRELVGYSQADYEIPALTLANPSPEERGLDLTHDQIAKLLPEFRAVLNGRTMDDSGLARMLAFFDEAGLVEWAVEFSLVNWKGEAYWASSLDRRVALSYGRIRTLTALLEEAVLSLAERTGDPAFAAKVEAHSTLMPRLLAYVEGPDGRKPVFDRAIVQTIYQRSGAAQLTLPIEGARLGAILASVGIAKGPARSEQGHGVAEKYLAALIFLRNVTSHRFPVVTKGERASWFTVWEEHINNIDRAVLWATLSLWSAFEHYTS